MMWGDQQKPVDGAVVAEGCTMDSKTIWEAEEECV